MSMIKHYESTFKIFLKELNMVAYSCNTSYLGAETGKMKVQGQSRQKVSKILCPLTSQHCWCASVILAMGRLDTDKNVTPYLKNN
jgi:hypothetical protein